MAGPHIVVDMRKNSRRARAVFAQNIPQVIANARKNVGNPQGLSPFSTFTEVSGSASLAVANGLSLFLSLSGTFGDDYEASTGSAGFRYQW
jgi:hypothetical protein